MPIIAMTHERGSKGSTIGQAVAERLGYAYHRQDILREAAREYQAAEHKLREAVQEKPGLFEMLRESARRYQVFIAAEVYEEALKDNVVLMGRWSTILLQGIPHVIRVRLLAPLPFRIRRIMDRDGVIETEAWRGIQRYDEGVRYRMKEFYGVEWEAPTLYDLNLNTERLSLETAVSQIAQLATAPEFEVTPDGITLLRDRTLAARVRAALKDHRETDHLEVLIEAHRGTVTLSGTVFRSEHRQAAERVTTEVPGVQAVTNDLIFTEMPMT